MNTNKKNGFTLIELIMVMIILGIMAAVAIPRYLETIEKSEVASEDAVVNNIMVALEMLSRYLGTATAAMIPKMTITMINSINVKPLRDFEFLIFLSLSFF